MTPEQEFPQKYFRDIGHGEVTHQGKMATEQRLQELPTYFWGNSWNTEELSPFSYRLPLRSIRETRGVAGASSGVTSPVEYGCFRGFKQGWQEVCAHFRNSG